MKHRTTVFVSFALILCILVSSLPPVLAAGRPGNQSQSYVAQVGNNKYSTLEEALVAAKSGETVTLLQNVTLTQGQALTVPAGVKLSISGRTLLLPCQGATSVNTSNNSCTAPNGAVGAITPAGEQVYSSLTVETGATVTVSNNGKLVVGGTFSGNSDTHITGGTYGSHSNIYLNGTLNVESSGIVNTYGYILGSGTLEIKSGGILYEPLVITDYRGGTYTAVSYGEHTPMFNSYGLVNVQAKMIVNSGAFLKGYCNVYVSALKDYRPKNPYLSCETTLINSSEALLNLSSGSITLTYETEPTYQSLGRTTIDINGSVDLGGITFISSYNTYNQYLPIPCNFKINVAANSSLKISKKAAILPDGEVVVQPSGSLTVSGSLLVLDGMASKTYRPDACFSQRGLLRVDGTMTIQSNAVFAGIVETTGSGTVVVEKDADLAGSYVDGLLKGQSHTIQYSGIERTATASSTTQIDYPLTARLLDAFRNELVEMTSNTTYYGYSDQAYAAPGFSYKAYAGTADSPTFTDKTSNVTAEMTGAWVDTPNYATVQFYANGGKGVMDNQPIHLGQTETLSENVFTREGYLFTGWSTTPNGNASYTTNIKINNTSANRHSVISLYAVWEEDYIPLNVPGISEAFYHLENGQVVLTLSSGKTGYAILACYDSESGKLLGCDVQALSPDTQLSAAGADTENCTCKLMIVNDSWAPQQAATEFKP